MNFIKKWRIQRLLSKIYISCNLLIDEGYEFFKDADDIREIIQKIRRDNKL